MKETNKIYPNKSLSPLKPPGLWYQFNLFLKDIEIPVLFIVGIGSVILGTIGFQKYFESAHLDSNFGTNLYASIGLLQMKTGNINASFLPIELEIARWSAPVVTMYTVVRGLWILFRKQLDVLHLRIFMRNHVVICGLGQIGLQLAKNFRNQGLEVVIIEKSDNNPFIPGCNEIGAIVLIGDAEDISTLYRAGIKRARHVIAISGNDSTNAKIATNARSLVRKPDSRDDSEILRCTIHIKDLRLWNVLCRQELSVHKPSGFRLEIFNLYDEAAFQLLAAYPLIDCSDDDCSTSPHILIVGMGDMGERLSLHISRQWSETYQITGKKLHISVIDPDAKYKVESLCRQFSLIKKVCKWDPYPIDTRWPNYNPEGLNYASLSLVFICIGDEGAGTSAALAMLEQHPNPDMKIVVRVNEDNGLEMMLNEVGQTGELPQNLHFFEVLESTCRPELLYDRLQEMIARSVHKDYCQNLLEVGGSFKTGFKTVFWDDLSEEEKQSNREQANHILTKLKAIQCDIIPWVDYKADKFTFKINEIEILAKMEHERWYQQKKDQGWSHGLVRDDAKKIHPDLLVWDDLKFTQDAKDKDRKAVSSIPGLLAQAGFQIKRPPAAKDSLPNYAL